MISLKVIRYLGRRTWLLMLSMLAMLLSACTILPTAPVSQVYLLPVPPATNAPRAQSVNWSLRVSQPATSQFLNSSRIAVQPQGQEIAVYQNSRWSDPAPILVRNRLIQEFRADGRIRAVSSDDDSLQADVELSGDLSAFQGVYLTDKSEVLIRFDARLVRISDRRIIATRHFEIRQPIKGTEMNEVVQAFGLASDQLATQVLNWMLQHSITSS
ncbi:ABC-type transport auxiliary lipoprotein family protein [Yersinia bercovieri]|uniref:ABC-type transport auxiliary lipoprotein family protein n=1 Tax=Yersinia bercovieri TaxID=634 RepID=UPI0005DC8DFB|nr:ABC-type transport auxiliary lipoprotein family protein [Yersinia bercovieri]MDN0103497.1 ABC-type transport auxiliary lipoprotein family protein [Yersinia bercovieri]CNF75099.1 membrane lipoprotein lipid attachment site containing protein USSDB6D [Yersinia bercovieri]CNI30508.1 membrane lipoprotein lipid attachment site containing protein USSDB6D [Yersinia bercovieri]